MILKLQSGLKLDIFMTSQSCNKRTYNKHSALNDYMERLHPMMNYGNFIEVYNNIGIWYAELIHKDQHKKRIEGG